MDNNVWIELLRGGLIVPFVGAMFLGWRGVRKDRLDARVSEHDMLGQMRAMLLADLESAKRERDQLRERVTHLEDLMARDAMLIAGFRTHYDYLLGYIGQHLPEGTKRPKPLPNWLKEDSDG